MASQLTWLLSEGELAVNDERLHVLLYFQYVYALYV